MKVYGPFKEIYDEIKDAFEYRLARLTLDITEKIHEIMAKKNISRNDLAKKMGVSRASVSQLLNQGSNITIKRLLKIAEALDCNVDVQIVEKGERYSNLDHFIEGNNMFIKSSCDLHFPNEYFAMGEYNESSCG